MIFEAIFPKRTLRIHVERDKDKYLVHIEGNGSLEVNAEFFDSSLSMLIGGKSKTAVVDVRDGTHYAVNLGGKEVSFDLLSEAKSLRRLLKSAKSAGTNLIEAKMPGKIVKILSKPGDQVEIDQGVIIMEAMKMENELRSPIQGKIREIKVQEGQAVEAGAILVVLEQ